MRTVSKRGAGTDPVQAAAPNRTKRYRAESDRYLTQVKRTEEWAFPNEVFPIPLAQALRHQSAAFADQFATWANCPGFEFRNGRQSAAYTRSAFRCGDDELSLARMFGVSRLVWSWSAVGPTTVTVSRDRDDPWDVSFAVDTDGPAPLPGTGDRVGGEFGGADVAVSSDGENVANLPRYERRDAARRVAVARGRVRRGRAGFLNGTTTVLVGRYGVIVIGNLLGVAGMVRQRTFVRAISGVGRPAFRTLLEYKAARWGRRLADIDRWHPSSRPCSRCGRRLAALSLPVRHEQDVSAAGSILA